MFAGIIIAAQGAALGGAAPSGPVELWPQPVFAASTGLTLLRGSITGGRFIGDGSGLQASATVTSPPTFAPGEVYAYDVTIQDSLTQDDLVIQIGGQTVTFPAADGRYTGTVTIGGSPVQALLIKNIENDAPTGTDPSFSAVSVKKVS